MFVLKVKKKGEKCICQLRIVFGIKSVLDNTKLQIPVMVSEVKEVDFCIPRPCEVKDGKMVDLGHFLNIENKNLETKE